LPLPIPDAAEACREWTASDCVLARALLGSSVSIVPLVKNMRICTDLLRLEEPRMASHPSYNKGF
jgi:hypothetical protein